MLGFLMFLCCLFFFIFSPKWKTTSSPQKDPCSNQPWWISSNSPPSPTILRRSQPRFGVENDEVHGYEMKHVGWCMKCMDVSENSGFSSEIIPCLIGFSIITHPFWGSPIFGNTHIDERTCMKSICDVSYESYELGVFFLHVLKGTPISWHRKNVWPAATCFFPCIKI